MEYFCTFFSYRVDPFSEGGLYSKYPVTKVVFCILRAKTDSHYVIGTYSEYIQTYCSRSFHQ